MKLCNIGHTFNYETEKLLRQFFPFEQIDVTGELCHEEQMIITTFIDQKAMTLLIMDGQESKYVLPVPSNADDMEKELILATTLYMALCDFSGYYPKWGLLTGIRPAKLFSRLISEMGQENAEKYFKEKFFVSDEKISLCKESRVREQNIIDLSSSDSFSLYISIPFCPSRCSYCSFVSHSVEKASSLIETYVELLCQELELTSKIANICKLKLETIYIGGGTPTTLSPELSEKLLSKICECFDFSKLKEFTVEAGRPDTFTKEKLMVFKKFGVSRISINPQTQNDEVLKNIGRNHTAKDTRDAFKLARELGFNNINMDIIAGLPGDTEQSFNDTLYDVLSLNPESVTVHALSLKRASNLNKNSTDNDIGESIIADKMVSNSRTTLTQNGLLPYYMYRQSKTVGNLENVGYAKEGFECLYNVFIMDETHTILACGASAVTKLREPNGNYIERIFNYKYPYEYISRFNDLIDRKKAIVSFYSKYKK